MSMIVTTTPSECSAGFSGGKIVGSFGWTVSGVVRPVDAINAVGVRRGQTHPHSSALRCVGITARPLGHSYYSVVAQYEQPSTHDQAEEQPEDYDPLSTSLPPEYQWDVGHQSIAADVDADGNPLLSSSREPPANTVDLAEPVVRVRIAKNETMFDLNAALQLVAHVNDNSFRIGDVIVPPLVALVVGIAPTGVVRAAQSAVRVQTDILILAPRTPSEKKGLVSPHDFRFLDEGTRGTYTDAGAKATGEFVWKDGTPTTRPVLLRGNGAPYDKSVMVAKKIGAAVMPQTPLAQQTPRGAVIETADDENASFLRYRKFARANFPDF